MSLSQPVLARSALFTIAVLLLFQAGCGQFKSQGKTVAVKLAPGVKLRLIYVEPLKIFVGKYEVSNKEYRCFRPEHSSGVHEGMSLDGDSQPVVNVSWNDARAFCDWLAKKYEATAAGKLNFRLPDEKEWECYATCGANSEFPWGAWPPPKNLNYFGRENKSAAQMLESYDGHRVSAPVNKSGANEWGLYGVGGNVWEWCRDVDDAQNATHVLKGASWADCAPLFLRTTRRNSYAAGYKYINLGFRVVAEPADLSKTPANKPAASDQSAPPAKPGEPSGK